MLRLGKQTVESCGRVSRRSLLQAGGPGAIGFGLGDLLQIEAQEKTSAGHAKSIILLWLSLRSVSSDARRRSTPRQAAITGSGVTADSSPAADFEAGK